MSFKIIDGQLENGNPRTLFRGTALSATQFKIIQDIIALHAGEFKLTSKQLIIANNTLRGKKYMPYFIGRNLSSKIKGTAGIYNLSVFKLAKSPKTSDAPAVEPPVQTPAVVVPKKKRESRPKRESSKGKRESVPVNTEPLLIEAPESTDNTIAQMEAVGIVSAE
jgi:hypothetical protein